MRGFLRSLAAQGRAVLVSSHLMSQLQDTADHVIVVGRGKVIADAAVAQLLAAGSSGPVTLRTGDPAATAVLRGAGGQVSAPEPGVLSVTGLTAQQVVALMNTHTVVFSEVSAHRATLEQVYLELTGDAVEFRAEGTQQVTR
jgi:ABC-2 type transport system ATP-binding protein